MLEKLQNSRKNAGLTQVDVERALGFRSLTMRDYESGRLKLPVSVAIDLAGLYKVSLDELLGVEVISNKNQQKSLSRFKGLFSLNRSQLVLLDPVIRAYLESNYNLLSRLSLFDILIERETHTNKTKIIIEFTQILASLAGIDSKVSSEEIESLNFIMEELGIETSAKKIKNCLKEPYSFQETSLKSVHLRHFTIWSLFLFAESSEEIVKEESAYIEQVAEKLKINRTNFLFIKDKFITEVF
jgi:transcriptional regulator with XRE-family HTH domain